MITKDKIEEILKQKLNPTLIEIEDESHLHASHAEAQKSGGGHFSLVIVTDQFQGKPLMQRHKLVYALLDDLMKSDIHALAIKAYTLEEYQQKS